MKYIISLIVLFWCATAHPEDFRPFVKIISSSGGKNSYYSGSIISETDKTYTVLTCWHGMDGLDEENTSTVVNLIPANSPSEFDIKPVSCYALFVKSNEPTDLALFKISKLPNVKIKPLSITEDKVSEGTECVAYGYTPDSNRLIENIVIIKSYTDWSDKGINFLSATGYSKLGPSGGPLVYNGKLLGTLSFRDTERHVVAFCPSSEVVKFLESK